MNGPLFDCYVLAPSRTAQVAIGFLDHFIPNRVARFDLSDPSEVLGLPGDASITDAVAFLEANPRVAYSMYWSRAGDDSPLLATLAFTADAELILGLSYCSDNDPHCASQTLEEMILAVGATHGYATVEEAPALTRTEFLRKAKDPSEAAGPPSRSGD